MSTWLDRLKEVIGPRGYDNSMRRSLQTVVLYEAKRIVAPHLPNLRPFQRKMVFMDQAYALVDSIDFLLPHQKEEIMWRTATSKELLKPDVAWKRVKLIDKELERIRLEVTPYAVPGRHRTQCVDLFVRDLFNKSGPDASQRDVPAHWEYAHNHAILAYRLYFMGDKVDETFPEAAVAAPFRIPMEKPPKDTPPPEFSGATMSFNDAGLGKRGKAPIGNLKHDHSDGISGDHGDHGIDVAAMILGEGTNLKSDPVEDRRRILQEVREHLDLLKEFEGSISEEDLRQRKRELFLALPPAPPPADANKKQKLGKDVSIA